MLDLLLQPEAWLSLATLTLLEVVLGIDNIIFLSIISSRLPERQQPTARRIGLALALLGRLLLLASIAWIIGLTEPVLSLLGDSYSWRDMVLFGGGLFLLAKATMEMHHQIEGASELAGAAAAATSSMAMVVTQIALLDLVFSLDSVLTAIGMVQHLPVMVIAILLAMAVMLLAAEPVSGFVNRHPTVKMLALAFLLLIGVALIADALHFHIPRGYLYFAVAFSAAVETLNLLVRRRGQKVASR